MTDTYTNRGHRHSEHSARTLALQELMGGSFITGVDRDDTNMDGSPDYEESHGGEDVPLYAVGAGSSAVSGVIEQNLVFDIMMRAFGWHSGK